MDDLMIALVTLCVLFCVYAMLTDHFKKSGSEVSSSGGIPRWSGREIAVPAPAVSASGMFHLASRAAARGCDCSVT